MNKDNGGPAFPRPYSHDSFNDETMLAQAGMTVRDYFAAKAMQGLIAHHGYMPGDFCGVAYKAADCMIAERNK